MEVVVVEVVVVEWQWQWQRQPITCIVRYSFRSRISFTAWRSRCFIVSRKPDSVVPSNGAIFVAFV